MTAIFFRLSGKYYTYTRIVRRIFKRRDSLPDDFYNLMLNLELQFDLYIHKTKLTLAAAERIDAGHVNEETEPVLKNV